MNSLNAVVVDFETRSKCDLTMAGADIYAADPSTQVLCCAFYDLTTDQKWLWYPSDGELPHELLDAIETSDFVVAHNARFDQMIWEYVAVDDHRFPELPREKWYCSAAQCRVNALPSALDKAARAINGKNKKDHKGGALIRKFSIPNAEGKFNEMSPDDEREMGDYCVKDVLATVELVRTTRLMSPDEHGDWLINEAINDRGLKVDRALAAAAQSYASVEQGEIAKELTKITGGIITKHSQHIRINRWVRGEIEFSNDGATILNLMTVYKKGEKKYSLDKSVRENILSAADSGDISISDDAYNVLVLTDDGNKSSVAKFKRMLTMADSIDSRVRGAFIFAGAGQTGRFSSKGMQVHNFKRACFAVADAELMRRRMLREEAISDVMDTLAKLLRPAIIPAAGKMFVVGDWSAIEGRFLPWLAASAGAEKVLDVFRRDEDIYVHTADSMNIKDRQIGKVATLALGYQGGVNAFASMGRNYGLHLPEAQMSAVVQKWRAANLWALSFWKRLERAAMHAVMYPSKEVQAGQLKYVYVQNLLGGTLLCILPNGGAIQYPFAKIEELQTDYGTKKSVTYLKASISPAADAKEWPRGALYGGLMAENACQAIAASLLKEKLRECDDVVMHVHDEIVLEVPADKAEQAAEKLQKIMEATPAWAKGLPLKAEPKIMSRYGK